MSDDVLTVYLGWDSREGQAYRVAEYTLRTRSKSALHVVPLKHKALRQQGIFDRPWKIDGKTGNFIDERDGKPFSTEFAFTRFLVPYLNGYTGWAAFYDADMLFCADIKELFDLRDESKAVMVVQHDFHPEDSEKMDGCPQQRYWRKNWSSAILWNCGHEANRKLTPEVVNTQSGAWLHGFQWLNDRHIGELPLDWNFLVGHSSSKRCRYPKVLHYTDGGPWFEEKRDVQYADKWNLQYHTMLQRVGDLHSDWSSDFGQDRMLND